MTKLHLSPKPATITLVNFAVSGLTSIGQLPLSLLSLSFTPNLITVIISTIILGCMLCYAVAHVSNRVYLFVTVLQCKWPRALLLLLNINIVV